MTTRKHYDSRLKAQVALEALKNQRTIAQIASEYGVHTNMVTQWKQRLLNELPDIFNNKHQKNRHGSFFTINKVTLFNIWSQKAMQ